MENVKLSEEQIELICDFMGYEKQNDGYEMPDDLDKSGSERCGMWYFTTDLPYMEWNFIIPVVNKIAGDHHFGDDNYERWTRMFRNAVVESLPTMNEEVILENILTYLKIKKAL